MTKNCFFVDPTTHLLDKIIHVMEDLHTSPLQAALAVFIFPTRRVIRLFQNHWAMHHKNRAILFPKCYAFNDFWQLPELEESPPPSHWQLHSQYVRHVSNHFPNASFSHTYAQAKDLLEFKEILDQAHVSWPLNEVYLDQPKGWSLLTQTLEHLPSKALYLKNAFHKLEKIWAHHPASYPLYVFGVAPESTHDHGLLNLILKQPQGRFYIWGYEPPTSFIPLYHPQGPLKKYGSCDENHMSPAAQFIMDAFSPTGVIGPSEPGNIQLYACHSLADEAKIISWSMKRVIVETNETVVLITPHMGLKNLVRLYLKQLGIQADDAAGHSLSQTNEGILAILLLEWLQDNSQEKYLALLKHPLITLGQSPEEVQDHVQAWELNLKRQSSLKQDALNQNIPYISHLSNLKNQWPFKAKWSEYLTLHQQFLEELAPNCLQDDLKAWFLEALQGDFGLIHATDYQTLLMTSWRRTNIRSMHGVHPRALIWEMTQAQGYRPDHVIMGGFNEGTWPTHPPSVMGLEDETLQSLHLTTHEARLGAMAQRLVPLLLAPHVLITRAEREDGSLTQPSRWWQRLVMAAKKSGHDSRILAKEPYQSWLETEVIPEKPMEKPSLPAIRQPLRSISVTNIERFLKNPFCFRLEKDYLISPLPPLDQDIDPRLFGQWIHALLYEESQCLPLKTLPLFAIHPLWMRRAEKILKNFRHHIKDDSHLIERSFYEVSGTLTMGLWTVKGVADRIDVLKDGTLRLIDYKTGHLPSRHEVETGPRVQLPLLAYMIMKGAFSMISPKPLSCLGYWSLTGDHRPFNTLYFKDKKDKPLDVWVEEVGQRVFAHLQSYEHEVFYPTLPTPDPFDQITRHQEWLG